MDSVIRLTHGKLGHSAYQLLNRFEPLEARVGYEVDEQLVQAWEEAVARIASLRLRERAGDGKGGSAGHLFPIHDVAHCRAARADRLKGDYPQRHPTRYETRRHAATAAPTNAPTSDTKPIRRSRRPWGVFSSTCSTPPTHPTNTAAHNTTSADANLIPHLLLRQPRPCGSSRRLCRRDWGRRVSLPWRSSARYAQQKRQYNRNRPGAGR